MPYRKPYPLLADEDLISLVADRDAGAFGALYDRHARACYSLAYRMLGSRRSAEDLVQEVFLAVWRKARTYKPERGGVRSWVLSIAHNRAVDDLRSRVRQSRALEKAGLLAAEFQPCKAFEEVSRNALQEQVSEALNGLPSEQREVLRLAYYAGHTHTEISGLLDLPPGTVKGRVRLGLAKLRDRFECRELAGQ